MGRFSICTLIMVAGFAAALPAFAGTGYRYDSSNSGYISDDALKPPFSLLWKHSTDLVKDPIISTPAVGPDAVYFCVEQKVFALNRLTGDIKWQFDTGTKVFSSPTYHEGRLYFGGQDSNLWVLNAGTGQPEWRFKVGGPIDCPPLIVGNMLYVGSDDDSLHAIDLVRQGQVWAFGTRDDIKAAPAFSRGNLYFASRDEHLYCVDSAGTLRWRAKLKNTNNFSAPVVDGDRGLVFVTSDQYLHCFDTASGQARWTPFAAGDLIVGSPALAASDRKLYFGSKDGAVYCVSALDGRALWKYPKGEGLGIEPILSSPTLLGNDTLLVRTGPKLMAALNRQTGDLLWEYRLATPPERQKSATTQPGGAPGGGGMMGMPGGAGMMGMPGGGGMMGMPGEGGMGPGGDMGGGRRSGGRTGRGRGGIEGGGMGGGIGGGANIQEPEPAKFDESLEASPIVGDGAVYVLGNCGALYAFDAQAVDDAAPLITEAVLDITGKDKYHFLYGLVVASADDPANLHADALTVPGLPPIQLVFKIMDEGTGVNPSSVELTMNGQKLEILYDAVGSQVWYILDPEHGPARPLPNGALNFVLKLRDWVGNQAVGQVSFTVDNTLPPLENRAAVGMGMMGGEGGMMGMPGMGMGGMMGVPGMPGGPEGMPGAPGIP